MKIVSFGPGDWPPALQEVIDDFSDVFDSMERFELLFDLAKQLDELNMKEWSNETKVHGCQSEAHIQISFDKKTGFHLKGAADAQIVQGLISITAIALEGLTLFEVSQFLKAFFSKRKLFFGF